MGFCNTTLEQEKPHQKTSDCAQKTASGIFFASNRNRTYQIERNPLETQQEKLTTTRETASGVFLYKYRHYSAELGRWLGRDPIEEEGGVNLYGFVGNDPIGLWDRLGLEEVEVKIKTKCEGEITGQFGPSSSTIRGVKGGGVILNLDYKQGDVISKSCCCDSWRWEQTVWTNDPVAGATSPYNDPATGGDDKPWYYNDDEYHEYFKEVNGVGFYDQPRRVVNKEKVIYWAGLLVLKCLDKDEKLLQDLAVIYYGFLLDTDGSIEEFMSSTQEPN